MEIKKKVCPHCGKIIESLYDKQLEYNYQAHLLACKKKELEDGGV